MEITAAERGPIREDWSKAPDWRAALYKMLTLNLERGTLNFIRRLDSFCIVGLIRAAGSTMPIPVISVAQMRAWEKATWNSGRAEKEVIERVGQILTKRLLQLTRDGDKILILAGKGHNGDDARAAQSHLKNREIFLLNVMDPKSAL